MLSLPMVSDGKRLGVLNVSHHPDFFEMWHQHMLTLSGGGSICIVWYIILKGLSGCGPVSVNWPGRFRKSPQVLSATLDQMMD